MSERQYRPLPDVECLKYHGTPDKPDIKIFVSHRIDLDSETIDNPLYIPVRCGAVYDEREGVTMLGDNTGENISEKRMKFCEYTVMYWAWKNIKADYYGLCHYRRYLSFTGQELEEWNEQRFFYENTLTAKSIQRHNLHLPGSMRQIITQNDVLTSVTYYTENVPIIPKCDTVKELFARHPGLLTSYEVIDRTCEIVKEKFPQYSEALNAELNASVHRGFNCFIMQKDLFDLMCDYLFGVLFELESLQENQELTESNAREMGYVGEILYGSFIRWLYIQGRYKIREQHIVLFANTSKSEIRSGKHWYQRFKNFLKKIFPAYRCSLRIEEKVQLQQITIDQQRAEIAGLRLQISQILAELQHLNQRTISTFWTQPHSFEYNSDKTKLDFWHNYPQATGDLRVIQIANAVLLKRLKKICDTLGVTFWLHGGSLIGGLRHAGFVPWDDDIDIAMLREDYESLKDFLSSQDTYEITEYYYIEIGTRSYRFRRTDVDSACFVDIFVYDHYCVSNNSEIVDWNSLTQKKLHLIQKAKGLCNELQSFPREPTLEGYAELRAALDKLFNTYIQRTQGREDSEWLLWGMDNNYEGPQAFAWNHGRIFSKSDIFPLKTCMYEGEEFFIPSDFEKYAFAEYGVRYVEMPKNMGDSIHMKELFSGVGEIEAAKRLIEKEQEDGQ